MKIQDKKIRKELLEEIYPLFSELIKQGKSGRFQAKDTELYKLRISYVNALSNLLRAYNTLLKDSEIEELEEEIIKLKELIEND